jgi:hypothetical protein
LPQVVEPASDWGLKSCHPPTEIQLPELHKVPAGTSIPAFQSLLTDEEVAEILTMTVDWVREHANEIPGFEPLGSYYRFHGNPIEHGSVASTVC